MTLLYTARERFDLLKRTCLKLHEAVHKDDFFVLVIVGHHLKEAIQRDPSFNPDEGERSRVSKAIYNEPMWRVCSELSNNEKHAGEKRVKNVVFKDVEVKFGYGVGRFGVGLYGDGEQSITVELIDGTEISALTFADAVIELYQQYFISSNEAT